MKKQLAKLAFLFINGIIFTLPVSYAIEDCGTSVTECELRQEINNLRTDIIALKKQIAELEKGNDKAQRTANTAFTKAKSSCPEKGDCSATSCPDACVPVPNHRFTATKLRQNIVTIKKLYCRLG